MPRRSRSDRLETPAGQPVEPGDGAGDGVGAFGVDVDDDSELDSGVRRDHACVVGSHVAGADHGDPR